MIVTVPMKAGAALNAVPKNPIKNKPSRKKVS